MFYFFTNSCLENEIIFVDGGSTDNSIEWLKQERNPSVEHGIKSVKQYRKKIFTPSKAEFLFSKFITSYRLS